MAIVISGQEGKNLTQLDKAKQVKFWEEKGYNDAMFFSKEEKDIDAKIQRIQSEVEDKEKYGLDIVKCGDYYFGKLLYIKSAA